MTPIDPKKVKPHEFESELAALDDATAMRIVNEYGKAPCRENPSAAARRAGFEAIRDKELQRAAVAGVVKLVQPETLLPAFEEVDLAAIARDGIPAVDWMVPGWIAVKDIALVCGGGGIGKSTMAADLAIALSSGRDWLGMTPERSYRTGFVDEEQGVEVAARLFLRLGDPNPNLFLTSGQGARLDTDEGAAQIEAWAKKRKLEVLIVDGTQQVAGDAERNDSASVGALFGRVFRLRDQLGLTTVLLHQKRKDFEGRPTANKLEATLGSVAWNTQPSTVWFCERGGKGAMNVLQVKRRGSQEESIVSLYSESGPDAKITLEGGGEVGDVDTKVSGCSEWLLRTIEENGGPVETKTLLDADNRLETPYGERTCNRAMKHLLSVQAVERLKRGWYQTKAAK